MKKKLPALKQGIDTAVYHIEQAIAALMAADKSKLTWAVATEVDNIGVDLGKARLKLVTAAQAIGHVVPETSYGHVRATTRTKETSPELIKALNTLIKGKSYAIR